LREKGRGLQKKKGKRKGVVKRQRLGQNETAIEDPGDEIPRPEIRKTSLKLSQ